jgi:predicted ribosomally synthesized peptide with SipW-like signal peptide
MKIVKSLSMIAAVVAIAGGATYAWLSDIASVKGSTFSAESLDLLIDKDPLPNEDYDWVETFNSPAAYTNLLPGNFGEQVLDIKKVGDVDGKAKIKFVASGDWQLINQLNIKVSYDKDHYKTWVPVAEGPLSAWNNGQFRIMDDILGANDEEGGDVDDKLASVKIEWSIPGTAGNDIQGKTVNVDTIFGFDQNQVLEEVKL